MSLVKIALEVYSGHYRLTIRPEYSCSAIVRQLCPYFNKHAKELWRLFVSHVGKKELMAVQCRSRYTVDHGLFAKQLGRLLNKHILDSKFWRWVIPDFSASTKSDEIVNDIWAVQEYISHKYRY